jgi:hypothetical protein
MNDYLLPWSLSADEFPDRSYASDQLEFLLKYAILAPSTLNTQPWLFRINMMDVELFADRRRARRVADPDGRELAISCGAALLNLRVAAEYFSHQYQVQLMPDPANADLLARFQLGLEGETSGEDIMLFHAITQRRSNPQPFEDKPVPDTLLVALEEAARKFGAWLHFIRDEPSRQTVAELVAEADRRQWADKNFRDEMARWVRSKPGEHGDGVPMSRLGMKNWLAFASSALIKNFDRSKTLAVTDRDILLHAPVLAILGTETDDVAAWVAAGQALQRVLLCARSEEVWASIHNQPIQVAELRERLGMLAGRGGFPQVLLRLGYGPDIEPMPRRSARQALIMHQAATHA